MFCCFFLNGQEMNTFKTRVERAREIQIQEARGGWDMSHSRWLGHSLDNCSWTLSYRLGQDSTVVPNTAARMFGS